MANQLPTRLPHSRPQTLPQQPKQHHRPEPRTNTFFDGDDNTWDEALSKLEAIEAQKQADREAEQALIEAEELATKNWELGTAEQAGRAKGMRRGVKVTLALAITSFVVVVGTWAFAEQNIKVNDPVPTQTEESGFSIDPTLVEHEDDSTLTP